MKVQTFNEISGKLVLLLQKLLKTRQQPTSINAKVINSSTAETFLQALTTSYNKNKFIQKMLRVREVFSNIKPFMATIHFII